MSLLLSLPLTMRGQLRRPDVPTPRSSWKLQQTHWVQAPTSRPPLLKRLVQVLTSLLRRLLLRKNLL